MHFCEQNLSETNPSIRASDIIHHQRERKWRENEKMERDRQRMRKLRENYEIERDNGERMRKWWGDRERMRKWGNKERQWRCNGRKEKTWIGNKYLSLSISPFSLHFLSLSIFSFSRHSLNLCQPAPRNALFVRWSVRFFTPWIYWKVSDFSEIFWIVWEKKFRFKQSWRATNWRSGPRGQLDF